MLKKSERVTKTKRSIERLRRGEEWAGPVFPYPTITNKLVGLKT